MSTQPARLLSCVCGHSRRDHDKDGGDCTGCKGCVEETTILDHNYVECGCDEYQAAA